MTGLIEHRWIVNERCYRLVVVAVFTQQNPVGIECKGLMAVANLREQSMDGRLIAIALSPLGRHVYHAGFGRHAWCWLQLGVRR
jgi:hypothetical protein